jgi:hypothetical protein
MYQLMKSAATKVLSFPIFPMLSILSYFLLITSAVYLVLLLLA